MRDRGLNRKRDRERMEREREESPEGGEKRVRTDTDVESTQSRQKKGQVKSIFLSDSDEEAIVDFIKQLEELYDKTNDSFKDKQNNERLWEQLAATKNLPIKTVKKWFETQCTRYGKLTQMKSGQAAEKSTEHQTCLKDSFSFLQGYIREFPSLLHSSHPRGLLQPQPQLQFQIHPMTQNLRWKSALHQMLLISLQAPVPSDDSLQSRLPPHLQIQS